MPPKRRCRKKSSGSNEENSTSSEGEQTQPIDAAPTPPASPSRLALSTEAVPPAPTMDAHPDTRRDNLSVTEDQLARIISSVMKMTADTTHQCSNGAAAPPVPISGHAFPPAPGNFSCCTARFDGMGRSAEEFESFVDAVETYKECTSTSDQHALRGLAMLLTDDAAVYWRGVRNNVSSWQEAVRRLRVMYGAPRPAHAIFRNIFAKEQDDAERSETFISRKRCDLARLPYEVPNQMQVDIIYGLLRRKVRKQIPRNTVADLDQLLERARYVEECASEVSLPICSTTPVQGSKRSVVTHSTDYVNINPNMGKGRQLTTNVQSKSDGRRERPRCTFCNRLGHTESECRTKHIKHEQTNATNKPAASSPLFCYGCGKAGTIRSKCDTCSRKQDKVEFQNLNLVDEQSRPTVSIQVFDSKGVAMADCGSSNSLASPGLYSILLSNGVKFIETPREIGLADGSKQEKMTLTGQTIVKLEGRAIPTTFVVVPGANNRTLLGRDFIATAGMIINISQMSWHFADQPNIKRSFMTNYEVTPTLSMDANLFQNQNDSDTLKLRDDEGCMLSSAERAKLDQLIISRAERFAPEGPPTTYAVHQIRVAEDQEPIASPPYRLSQNKRDILDTELQKLLRDNIIEECESPWAANVVLVPKKDGGMRLCVDYRKLNQVTEPDRYPLPRIEDVLHAAKTTRYMTTLDLQAGYFQVAVADDDRDKTAFITPSGTYRFKRMPMGLRNSGATFQRLIDRLKSNLFVEKTPTEERATETGEQSYLRGRPVSLLAYLDDLIILSDTYDNHLEDLEAVLNRLALFNLRINRKKSYFACDAVKFLGHIIVPGGLRVDPEKTSAIADREPPKNIKQLKSFVALTSWFRRFVPNYASVVQPLTNLLKKNVDWEWRDEQQRSFNNIKRLLISAPILRQADETKPFELRTDSSAYCLGAVLMQGEGPDERPVEYASRLLAPACCGGELSTCEVCEVIVDLPHRDTVEVRKKQLKDPEVQEIIEEMEADDDEFRGRSWANQGYVPSDGALYRYGPEADCNDSACHVVPQHERGQTAKFIPRRDGPYRVTKAVNSTTVELENPFTGKSVGKYHVSHISPYVGSLTAPVREKRQRGRPRKHKP